MHFILLLIFFIPQLACAQAASTLQANEDLRELTTEVMTLRDESGDKTFAEIRQLDDHFVFSKQPLSMGYTNTTHWFRFTLQRTADAPKEWLLSATPGFLNNLRLYIPNNKGDFTMQQAGSQFAAALRPIDKQFGAFTFAITLDTAPTTFYLRLQQSYSASILNLAVASPAALAQSNSQQKFLLGLIAGGLLILLISTLIMWQDQQHGSYIALTAYITTSIMLLSLADGVMAQYLLPNQPTLVPLLAPLGTCLLVLFFTFFVIFFFGTQHYFPRLHVVFLGLAGLAVLTIFSIPLGLFIYMAPILLFSTLILLPCNVYVSWVAARIGMIGSNTIYYGFFLYFICSLALMLSLLGFISVYSLNLLFIQMSLLIILLFIGLYQRFQNINQLKQDVEAQIESAEKASAIEKQRNEEKSTFLNLVAHETKIPLAVIDSALQVLESLPFGDNEITSERHKRIRKSILHLNDLLENTFSAERYENSPLQPRVSQFLLPPFVEQIINKTVATEDRCHIKIANDHYCTADYTLLNLALSNLLSNAVKYSPADTIIHFTAKKTRDYGSNGTLLSISNTFISEDEPDTTNWFTKYYRQNRQANIDGLGLGLYLVQQIAQAHGGSIECIVTPHIDHWLLTMNLWLPDPQE